MDNVALKLKEAFLAGTASLTKKKDYINELNVFPVPDGDTGTNMTKTLEMAAATVNAISDNELTVPNVCKAVSSGSLRGARGNSGVIMSQILRGFTNSISEDSEKKNLNANSFLKEKEKAKETAYKAVIKPKEGTILTVVRALAEEANKLKGQNLILEEMCEKLVVAGDDMLAKTIDMLPILKEAGVVDSGGQGLMAFCHGILSYVKGEKIDYDITKVTGNAHPNINLQVESDQDIKFGYCTECMINTSTKFDPSVEGELKNYLDKIGDSLVVVADETLIKIHVHTNHPGQVFEKGLEYGFLTNLKVDNLKLEHQEKLIKDASRIAKENKKPKVLKNIGFISVANGDGLKDMFKDLNVDYVISGGQTMNPSTEDFMEAIDKVNAKNIFIFPNNGNVIMAAKQAKDLVKDKNILVIETKNILQGLNCLIYYTEKENLDEIVENFKETISNMKTMEATFAVRNTTIDGIDIKEGDIITLGDKGLLATNADIYKSIMSAYEKIKEDKDSIVSIYYGEEVNEDDAEKLKEEFLKLSPSLDVTTYQGGQKVYYYYISVE